MARRKQERFAENKTFHNLIEIPRSGLQEHFPLKGKWAREHFKNNNPIVLELGCGKGEYSVGMAQEFPNTNFIGVDIKGARLWYGAKGALDAGLENVAFLRTQIELLEHFFAPGEVSEIWITFPDPQIKYKRAKHRLTAIPNLERYNRLLQANGTVHLKTDSAFLHGYTHGLLEMLGHPVLEAYHDIDKQLPEPAHLLHKIRTYYEALFRAKGFPVTYIRFAFKAA
jgi:tRNA (guanine-N7-)-methyltransferase